jgi:hypothetical protein
VGYGWVGDYEYDTFEEAKQEAEYDLGLDPDLAEARVDKITTYRHHVWSSNDDNLPDDPALIPA